MLNRFLTAAALLAAFGAAPARATLDVAFSDGTTIVTCADQTACDLDGAAKNLLLINTVVGNFRIEGTFAASSSGDLSFSNLTIFNNGATTGTLRLIVGDTDFADAGHRHPRERIADLQRGRRLERDDLVLRRSTPTANRLAQASPRPERCSTASPISWTRRRIASPARTTVHL